MSIQGVSLDVIIKYYVTYNVTSNECIAGNGYIPKRNDTSEYIKEWYKGSVSLQKIHSNALWIFQFI